MNSYKLYDVIGNGFKFIHCNPSDVSNYMMITLLVVSPFVTTFSWSSHLNVGFYIQAQYFCVIFETNLSKGTNCWLIIKIRATIIIELINPFSNLLGLFVIHLIYFFMQRHNLKEFRTIELVVNGIFQRSKRNFILHIANGSRPNNV
jgi:hypothetical protein